MSKREKSPPNKTEPTSPVEPDKKQKLSYTGETEAETKDKASLWYNEHLRQEHVIDIFIKLGFSEDSIISEVTLEREVILEGKAVSEEVPHNEISNNAALSKVLQTVLGKSDHNQNLILLKVNTISKSFAEKQEENNHYVALYFSQDNDQTTSVTYLDPTGAEISAEISKEVSKFSKYIIYSSSISLQFTKPEETKFGEKILGGNDYDCGVLLPLAAKLVKEGGSNIALKEHPSRDLGQELRKLISQDVSWDTIENNIYNIIYSSNDLEQKSDKQYANVITITNELVDKVYGNRVVKLDTSCLFGEKNWAGIKKILRLATDDKSNLADEVKKSIRDYVDICEKLGLDNFDKELKLSTLLILNDSTIHFNLYKRDERVGDGDIYTTITNQTTDHEKKEI